VGRAGAALLTPNPTTTPTGEKGTGQDNPDSPPLVRAVGLERAKELYRTTIGLTKDLGWTVTQFIGHLRKWYLENAPVDNQVTAFYGLHPSDVDVLLDELRQRRVLGVEGLGLKGPMAVAEAYQARLAADQTAADEIPFD
jgi:hypothetical protein